LRAPAREATPLLQDEPDVELVEYINGSPRVALEIANPFARYVLIEPDPSRAARLEALREEYRGSRQIDVLRQNAASGIEWLLTQNISRRTHRGVVFLDPFGADLDWVVIEALASTRVFEVVINFALNMAIQRMLPNSADFQTGWRDRLHAYFGTSAWYEAAKPRMKVEHSYSRPELRNDTTILKTSWSYIADDYKRHLVTYRSQR
jgi:three-Cys-motif partner protein